MIAKQRLVSAVFSCATALVASPSFAGLPDPGIYQAPYEVALSGPVTPVKQCVSVNQFWQDCEWNLETAVGTPVTFDTQFADDPGNRVVVEGVLKWTSGRLSIGVNGARYNLADDVEKNAVPLPAGSTSVTLKIHSTVTAKRVGKGYTDAISGIKLILRNDTYVMKVVDNARAQVVVLTDAMTAYKKEKQLVKFITLSHDNLALLKPVLTGRKAEDLTDKCDRDGEGHLAPLDPDECKQLEQINRILRGEPTLCTEATKAEAFARLVSEKDLLVNFRTYLVAAGKHYEAEQLAIDEALLTIFPPQGGAQ